MADARGPLYVAYSAAAPSPPPGLRAVSQGEWIQVWRRVRVPWTVKGVGLALATFADWNDGTRIRPGNKTLAAICSEMHPKTIERAIGVIRGYDLIWRYVEGSREGKEGVNDEYRLTIPDDILVRVPLLNPDYSAPFRTPLRGLLDHGTPESRGCGQTADLAARNCG